jgi:hypothetical protein
VTSAPYVCRAFKIPLREFELRIECSEFKPQT